LEAALVTGGAGFIGSFLSERLNSLGWRVSIIDNLSSGSRENLAGLFESNTGLGTMRLLAGDCTNPDDLKPALANAKVVFHFAANPEVRLQRNDTQTCFRQNVYATHVLLEALKDSPVHTVVFASSSTVYGDATQRPTPEDYAPLEPISAYGAAKLASEALLSAYCHLYGKRAVILRLANIVGPRSQHGIIPDLLAKLRTDPTQLLLLGDGRQTKSYCYVEDCVDAILHAYAVATRPVEVFNVGSEDQVGVTQIADIVIREMGLTNVNVQFDGGVDGGRGWPGDVKNALLAIDRLKAQGWRPRLTSEAAIRRTVRTLLQQKGGVKTE
jgi:UDP-glucose 4-epimerase